MTLWKIILAIIYCMHLFQFKSHNKQALKYKRLLKIALLRLIAWDYFYIHLHTHVHTHTPTQVRMHNSTHKTHIKIKAQLKH